MSSHEKIKAIVFGAIDEFNMSQEVDAQLKKSENEILFSRSGFTEKGTLDSLSLVYFLVTIEEYVQNIYGQSYSLKIQELIERKEETLKDIAALIAFIEKSLQ